MLSAILFKSCSFDPQSLHLEPPATVVKHFMHHHDICMLLECMLRLSSLMFAANATDVLAADGVTLTFAGGPMT